MTYAQEVMKTAHTLYKANGIKSRDMFAACLSAAHSIVKARRAAPVVINMADARRSRISARVMRSMRVAA